MYRIQGEMMPKQPPLKQHAQTRITEEEYDAVRDFALSHGFGNNKGSALRELINRGLSTTKPKEALREQIVLLEEKRERVTAEYERTVRLLDQELGKLTLRLQDGNNLMRMVKETAERNRLESFALVPFLLLRRDLSNSDNLAWLSQICRSGSLCQRLSLDQTEIEKELILITTAEKSKLLKIIPLPDGQKCKVTINDPSWRKKAKKIVGVGEHLVEEGYPKIKQ